MGTDKVMSPSQSAKTLLFINSRFFPLIGGGETYVLEVMRHFSEQGWDVHLATKDCGSREPKWGNCTIHYIDGFDDEAQEPRKSLHDMRLLLDKLKPDLVHVHNIWPFFTYSNVVVPGEFPTILTIHNVPVPPERLFGNGSLGSFSIERAFLRQLLIAGKHQKLLVGSRYYLDSFAGAIPELQVDGKTQVAYYFSPHQTKGPLQPKKSNFTDQINVLFPSRVMDRKGIKETLHAIAKLPERYKLILPAFASGGFVEYQNEIKILINDLGVSKRVTLATRPTPPDEMPEYYKQADIVIVPSHFEGFGIVALEAMTWGLPVIVSDIGGLNEIVQHEVNGLLIQPKDVDGLVSSIERIADDKSLREKLVAGGLDTGANKFTHKEHMELLGKIYADVQAAH